MDVQSLCLFGTKNPIVGYRLKVFVWPQMMSWQNVVDWCPERSVLWFSAVSCQFHTPIDYRPDYYTVDSVDCMFQLACRGVLDDFWKEETGDLLISLQVYSTSEANVRQLLESGQPRCQQSTVVAMCWSLLVQYCTHWIIISNLDISGWFICWKIQLHQCYQRRYISTQVETKWLGHRRRPRWVRQLHRKDVMFWHIFPGSLILWFVFFET